MIGVAERRAGCVVDRKGAAKDRNARFEAIVTVFGIEGAVLQSLGPRERI